MQNIEFFWINKQNRLYQIFQIDLAKTGLKLVKNCPKMDQKQFQKTHSKQKNGSKLILKLNKNGSKLILKVKIKMVLNVQNRPKMTKNDSKLTEKL